MTTAEEDAALALMRAANWDLATSLAKSGDQDRDWVPGIVRELELDRAFWTKGEVPSPTLHDHEEWGDRWFDARVEYTRLLQERLAGRAPDTAEVEALQARLVNLLESASERDAPAVHFYLGVVHENLLGQPEAATPHWLIASADSTWQVKATALRHLAGQASDRVDDAEAQRLHWESFLLRAKHGDTPGALAQLKLLARWVPLEDVVEAWAQMLGLIVLQSGPAQQGEGTVVEPG